MEILGITWMLVLPMGIASFLPCSNPIRFSSSKRATCPPISRNSGILQSKLSATTKLTDLPKGISPFEKADAKSLNLGNDFRAKATRALQQACKDGKKCLEVEFPPLLFKGKTQFDDFDNVQELDLNRDWCIEWLPSLAAAISVSTTPTTTIWFALPDLKECELAKQEWTGSRYRNAAQFTTIEAITRHYTQDSDYKKPWGASFANMFAGGMLGDKDALDELSGVADLHLICQPGNGGPVEDWVNCEILHNNAGSKSATTVIVNGALDKVRDGYYPGVFFPALAATVDRFYKPFESIFYLRPISDKGAYGWLFRVYPEDWQVILQTAIQKNGKVVVENSVVYTSTARPTYATALQALLKAASST